MQKIELFKVYMSKEAPALVGDVLLSGWIGQAEKVEAFEGMLRAWFQNDYCNTLNSATSGLHLALHYAKLMNRQRCGMPSRDEILTTPLTCAATNFPILANGLKVRWVDIDPDTCNIDLDDLERKLSPRTLAIMVVHWGGMACDLNRLAKIRQKCCDLYDHRPMIIEDCAHAWGASYDGKLIGTHGNVCVFSFQAIKHLTSVTPDTPVLVRINGRTSLVPIGQLDNSIIGQECISFSQNGKTRWSRITGFVAHEIEDHVLEVVLEEGRRVKITGSHSVYTHDGSAFQEKAGRDLMVGDYLAIPRSLPLPDSIMEHVDVLDLLPHETLMVREDKVRLAYEGRGANAGKWTNRYIPINPDLCRLLGYYAAKGGIQHWSRNGKHSSRLIFSFGPHEQHTWVTDVIAICKRLFPAYTPKQHLCNNKSACRVVVGGPLLAKIITAMGGGTGVYNKCIPWVIWESDAACRHAFLEGYFRGVRCQDEKKIAKSASSALTNGVHYLCLSLGIQSRLAAGHGHKGEKTFQAYAVEILAARENCIPAAFVPDLKSRHVTLSTLRKTGVTVPGLMHDVGLLRIKKIVKHAYAGAVYDFSVARDENFVGGFGAIHLHNTGDGGLIISGNLDMHEEIKLLRWYGLNRNSTQNYRCSQDIKNWGYKMHMNDINAAIGICNLPESVEVVRRHRENGAAYDTGLAGVPGLTLLKKNPKVDPSYWVYTLRVEDRPGFQKKLADAGIVSSLVHKRNDLHACLTEYRSPLPGLEVVSEDMICIPSGWWVRPDEIEYIINTIKSGW